MHGQRTSPADRLREALSWRPVPGRTGPCSSSTRGRAATPRSGCDWPSARESSASSRSSSSPGKTSRRSWQTPSTAARTPSGWLAATARWRSSPTRPPRTACPSRACPRARAPASGIAVLDDRGREHRDPRSSSSPTTRTRSRARRVRDSTAAGWASWSSVSPPAAHRPRVGRDLARGRGGKRHARRARWRGGDPRSAAASRSGPSHCGCGSRRAIRAPRRRHRSRRSIRAGAVSRRARRRRRTEP